MSNKIENILSDKEKVDFLNAIKSKGEKPDKSWVLIHSAYCTPEEGELDFNSIVESIELNEQKFAIDVVSNANLKSFLDSGRIKVRYRYVLAREFEGEPLIKDNTREFCEEVIKKDVIFRREDINIMSFRGVNPIAKTNYSIFKLKGHWNCRHAWLREIYLLPPNTINPNKGTIINSELIMSEKKQTVKEKFGEFITGLGRKLTEQEIVDLTATMLSETIEQKFVDVDVDGKKLRIDGEKVVKDAPVSWVDESGNMTDVDNSEITVEIEGKKMILTIADRKISDIKDVAEAEAAKTAEQQMSAVLTSIENLKKEIPTMIDTAISTKLSANNTEQVKVLTTIVEAKLKNIPAFKKEEEQRFSTTETVEGKNMLERMTIGSKKP